ncbi:MAG TPA: hypothetical protein VMF30_13795 [Pirellulales bacterium]|nr:hypothetical protein [Pirellulales bacterium]
MHVTDCGENGGADSPPDPSTSWWPVTKIEWVVIFAILAVLAAIILPPIKRTHCRELPLPSAGGGPGGTVRSGAQ